MKIIEAHGKKRKISREIHHLRVHGHPHGTPENPAWVIEHHENQDDPNPEAYEFHDGQEMLAHLAHHANVPEPEEENSGYTE